jgi:hypothetical protein
LHECTNKFHGCIRMNATCSVNTMWLQQHLTLYSNHFINVQISSPVEKYLSSLLNLMYNCSSSVKDLTPKQSTRATLLKIITILTHLSNT